MRWPKYWSFSFSIIPSNEHPGLISFRMDWLDLLAVQRIKSINSSALSFLHSPTLTSIHDHWKNHSLDYAEYIMRNSGLEEAQAGIKIAGRNISNLRYADDTTLIAESKEELKSPLMKVKEESGKSWLKIQHLEN